MNVTDFKRAIESPKPRVRKQAQEVAVAAHRMLCTPIVDDDFPEMKYRWQSTLEALRRMVAK